LSQGKSKCLDDKHNGYYYQKKNKVYMVDGVCWKAKSGCTGCLNQALWNHGDNMEPRIRKHHLTKLEKCGPCANALTAAPTPKPKQPAGEGNLYELLANLITNDKTQGKSATQDALRLYGLTISDVMGLFDEDRSNTISADEVKKTQIFNNMDRHGTASEDLDGIRKTIALLEGKCIDYSPKICKEYKTRPCENSEQYVKICTLTCNQCPETVNADVFNWQPKHLDQYACQQITLKDCKLGTTEKKERILAYLIDESILTIDDSGLVKAGACKKKSAPRFGQKSVGVEQCREKYDGDIDYNTAELEDDDGHQVCSGVLDHFFDKQNGNFDSHTQQLCCRNALDIQSNNMAGEPDCDTVFDVESKLSWFPFKF
jgi:hypothetical protein